MNENELKGIYAQLDLLGYYRWSSAMAQEMKPTEEPKVPAAVPRRHRYYPHPADLHASQFVDDEAMDEDGPEEEEEVVSGEDFPRGRDRTPDGDDLAEFFGDLPEQAQIAICRTYANYLSARARGAGRVFAAPLHSRRKKTKFQ